MSIAYTTGKSIRFIGTGEKLSDIELFYPDRMASRILGMGDVLSLIDRAQSSIDEEKAKALEAKLRTQDFDFNDFLDQLEQLKEMGSMTELLEMMPGINKKALKGMDFSEDYLVKSEAIIQSMTMEERAKPHLINGSRRKRIATGSGTTVSDINRLMKNFEQSKKMLKQMTNTTKAKKGRFKLPFM